MSKSKTMYSVTIDLRTGEVSAVAAAKPACPDPVTMLAVVERRLRALDAQVARLQLLGKRLGVARAYLRRRRRRA